MPALWQILGSVDGMWSMDIGLAILLAFLLMFFSVVVLLRFLFAADAAVAAGTAAVESPPLLSG